VKPLTGSFRPEWFYWAGRLWREPVIELREGALIRWEPLSGEPATPIEGLLSPAWFNAHTHLELSHLKGKLLPGKGMVAFLAAMGPARGKATPAQIREALQLAAEAGTWSFVSHQNTFLLPEAIPPGVRVYPLAEYFGLSPHRSRRRLWTAKRLAYPLTPHSFYALSRGLLRAGRRPSSQPKSVHFFESLEEKLWLLEGKGPFRAFFRRFVRRVRPVDWGYWLRQWYRRAPALWLVHATEVPPPQMEGLLRRYPRLYGVLCPIANQYLFRRGPDLEFWKRWPGRFLLGTDSLANSPSLSVWPVVRYLVQGGLSWEVVLQAAADTPFLWFERVPHWVQVAPLASAAQLRPDTQARTLAG